MSVIAQGRQAMTNARLAALRAFDACWPRALSNFEVDVVQEALAMADAGRAVAITDPMTEVIDRSWAAVLRARDGRTTIVGFTYDDPALGPIVVGGRRGGLV